jgi:hypothetical protein
MLLVQANVGIERQQQLSCEELTYELRWDDYIPSRRLGLELMPVRKGVHMR